MTAEHPQMAAATAQVADCSPAEALARALHPERDARVGDWGPRVWREMRPEGQQAAIEHAQATVDELRRLGFDITARQEQGA